MQDEKHVCLHEGDLAKMGTTLETVCTDVKDLKKFLIGDNGEGILRKLKGLKTHVVIQWFFVGGISLSILGLFLWVIRVAPK